MKLNINRTYRGITKPLPKPSIGKAMRHYAEKRGIPVTDIPPTIGEAVRIQNLNRESRTISTDGPTVQFDASQTTEEMTRQMTEEYDGNTAGRNSLNHLRERNDELLRQLQASRERDVRLQAGRNNDPQGVPTDLDAPETGSRLVAGDVHSHTNGALNGALHIDTGNVGVSNTQEESVEYRNMFPRNISIYHVESLNEALEEYNRSGNYLPDRTDGRFMPVRPVIDFNWHEVHAGTNTPRLLTIVKRMTVDNNLSPMICRNFIFVYEDQYGSVLKSVFAGLSEQERFSEASIDPELFTETRIYRYAERYPWRTYT